VKFDEKELTEACRKIEPILCTYNHEHLGNDDCDGRSVLCGYCSNQARRLVRVTLGLESNEPTAIEVKMMGAKRGTK